MEAAIASTRCFLAGLTYQVIWIFPAYDRLD